MKRERGAPADEVEARTTGQDWPRTWLRLLFDGLPGVVELRALDPTGEQKPERRWSPKGKKVRRIADADLEEAAIAVAELERAGLNVYAGIATRRPRGGKKEDLGFVRAVWCDLDGWADRSVDDLVGLCEVVHDVPAPSMIVHSGGGYHAYWLLDEPLRIWPDDEQGRENLARLEAINRGLARILRGDPSATDATRILRPPGTTNRPGPEKRAKGRADAPVRLLHADGACRYALDDLAAFEQAGRLRVVEGGGSTAEPQYERPEDVDAELPERVREIRERDDRVRARYDGDAAGLDDPSDSGIDMSLACLLRDRGCTGAEVELALRRSREERGAEKNPERKGEGYFVRTTNRALESAGAGSRESAAKAFAGDLAREILHGDTEDAKSEAAPRPKGRPTILQVDGQLPAIVAEAEAALLGADAPIYQRAGVLVRPARLDEAGDADGIRRPAGALVLLEVREPWLVMAMARAARWEVLDRKGEPRNADPRARYAKHLLGDAGNWSFPVLRGVVGAPTIVARTGRVVQEPGYDRETGLLLDFDVGAFPKVPDRPSEEGARQALERLAHPLRAYRFDPEASGSRSAALSCLLCAVARPGMRTCPLHAFDAPTRSSGKTKLAECAGVLSTGVKPSAASQGRTDEEFLKRLDAALVKGDPVILVDNCDRPVGGDRLCQAITGEDVEVRILGRTENRKVPSTALMMATGNNLVFSGDACSRVVKCRIDPGTERPETREFDFDPVDEAREGRPELVAAALTVLRAYHVAGRPLSDGRKPTRFPDYDFVRGALAWLGEEDPARTLDDVEAVDPEKEMLAEIVGAWGAAFEGRRVTLAEIDRSTPGGEEDGGPDEEGLEALRRRAAVRELILEAVPGCRGQWNPTAIGIWLAKHRDRVVCGRRFRRERSDSRRWYLEQVHNDD